MTVPLRDGLGRFAWDGPTCELCHAPAMLTDILCYRCSVTFAAKRVKEQTAYDAIPRNIKAAKALRRMMK